MFDVRRVNVRLFHPPDTMPGPAARGPAGHQEMRYTMGKKWTPEDEERLAEVYSLAERIRVKK